MWRNTPEAYGRLSKILHWLMTLMIFAMVGVGIFMTGLDRADPLRGELTGTHKAVGFLVLLRIGWTLYSRPPTLPAALQSWEKLLTRIVAILNVCADAGNPHGWDYHV